MIFAHTLDVLLAGTKRQTRRLVKPHEQLHHENGILRVLAGQRTLYQVGKTYAVQPNRGKKSVGRILLTNLRRETVESISEWDALAEGFSSRQEFLNTWYTIHGQAANIQAEVWVLEFELCAIVAEELKILYEQRNPNYRSVDYSYDLPTPLEKLSGVGLHSRSY